MKGEAYPVVAVLGGRTHAAWSGSPWSGSHGDMWGTTFCGRKLARIRAWARCDPPEQVTCAACRYALAMRAAISPRAAATLALRPPRPAQEGPMR